MKNENLLIHKYTVKQYKEIMRVIGERINIREDKDYWELLGNYIIAKCPICGVEYKESLDTYSLRRWERAIDGDAIFHPEANVSHCEHFIVVQHFINYNGYTPEVSATELLWAGDMNSEVPHVMPMLFDEEIESYAVMHSLPICKIEDDRFVPRYTLYTLTYYTHEEHIEELKDRLRHWEPEVHKMQLLTFPISDYGEAEEWWDLSQWVQQGKLFWLEPDNPELPLIKGPVEKFPYGNITGRKMPYFESVPKEEKKSFFGRLFGSGK